MTKALLRIFGAVGFRLAVSADGSTFFDGLSVDNATSIVDQPRPPRFKACKNYDNYVGVGTWTKIAINNTDTNDQGAFDAANHHFVAPVDGTYLFGATLMYKVNASTTARMSGRLVLNGTTEIRGSMGEVSSSHVSEPPLYISRSCSKSSDDGQAEVYTPRTDHADDDQTERLHTALAQIDLGAQNFQEGGNGSVWHRTFPWSESSS